VIRTGKVQNWLFTYSEFRKATGLSKKEADSWVRDGIVVAERAANGRRRLYTLESLMEGNIARKLADFSSRELLSKMMDAFREYVARERISLAKVSPDLNEKRQLVKLYTLKSEELSPGGGVRGVIACVGRYEPRPHWIEQSVFLVVDLNLVAATVLTEISQLSR